MVRLKLVSGSISLSAMVMVTVMTTVQVMMLSARTASAFTRSSTARPTLSRALISSTSRLSLATKSDERSAASKSRAPFRMPKNSPDDSKASADSSFPANQFNGSSSSSSSSSSKRGASKKTELKWNPLGLLTEIVDSLENELHLKAPTAVQSLVIPQLLDEEQESLAFLSATGSGKTLAYLLPLIQQLKQQELFENYERRPRRPRLLILTPTRELALQITQVLKSLSHSVKLSSQALVGGQDKGSQRKALKSRPVDVVVATPGRLLLHWKDETVFMGGLQTIVLDEMDTMLEQGFQRELRELLYPLLYANTPKQDSLIPPEMKEGAPRIVLTSATMTQSIQKLLGDNPKTSDLNLRAKKLHNGASQGGPMGGSKLILPRMKIISAPGLHKAIPRLDQVFVDVGNSDKISLLIDVASSGRHQATIIFCNTASSVQAAQYALAEAGVETISYHGELNSQARSENLKLFRQKSDTPKFLVCTDLAARGLDIPEVDHVVMFDFPLNAMDYLHRSGRTARGAGRGKVTALVAKRDRVLATAIENAVIRGDSLDGLSSRKSDYLPGARFGIQKKRTNTKGGKKFSPKKSGGARKPSRSRR